METEFGRNAILWTVRLSVALYCVSVCWYLLARRRQAVSSHYLKVWAASWVLCVIHVVCAYHFEHHWSQAAARKHTAEMTDRVVGLYWSGGLYVNYVFLAVWGADVFRGLTGRKLTPLAIHLVTAFMMFNATVVFGPRWWIIPASGFVAFLFWVLRQPDRNARST